MRGFDSTFDVTSQATVECSGIAELDPTKLLGPLEKYGFVLVSCDGDASDEAIRGNVLALRPLLGSTAPHQLADADGIVDLFPEAVTFSGYKSVGRSNQEFEAHTDGSFLAVPDEVVTLTCRTPSQSGGESILISATALYDHLCTTLTDDEMHGLFRDDAVAFGRGGEVDTKGVFKCDPDGRMHVVWRRDLVIGNFDEVVHPAARAGISAFDAFCNDPNMQLKFKLKRNQLLILNNSAILHSRTPFGEGEMRFLHRCNFFTANGALAATGRFRPGFNPEVGRRMDPCWSDGLRARL